MLIGITTVSVMGQAGCNSKVITAEKFVLRDTMGKMRASLEAEAASSAGLYLCHGEGTKRAEFSIDFAKRPTLIWYGGKDGQPRAQLYLFEDQGTLQLYDRHAAQRISLGTTIMYNPELLKTDPNRAHVIGMSLTHYDEDGNAYPLADLDRAPMFEPYNLPGK